MAPRRFVTEHSVRFQATRASGPGGERTNRRATKVHLWVAVDSLPLSREERARLRERLGYRITKRGDIEVTCEAERFQVLNRALAVEHLNSLIALAVLPEMPRIPTEPPRSVEERRFLEKHLRSERRRTRHRVDHPGEAE